MKKIVFALLAVFVLGAAASAQGSSINITAEPGKSFMSGKLANGITLGYVKSGSSEAAVARWSPDWWMGNFGLGLDINIPMGDKKPTDIETVVLRFAEYRTDDFGVRYGIVENYTLGFGLLVNNYSSVSRGSIIQSNQQTGLTLRYRNGIYGLQAIGTWSRFYGVRVTEQVAPLLTLGQYYVTDADGVNFKKTDGTQVSYPAQSGFGLDASVPLSTIGVAFLEYAKINNHGAGISAGVNAGYDFLIARARMTVARRWLDRNFVPGYFNENYETDPINVASYEASSTAKDGYFARLDLDVLGKGNGWAMLESYNGSNASLKAEATAVLSDDYWASAGFYQPNFVDFRSLNVEEGAIITGKVGYKVNPYTSVIANYKKAYDPVQGRIVETQWYEVSLNF